MTFQPKPPPLAAAAPSRVRQHALELLTEVRYDPDGFKPRGFMERNEPQRSAWRTFRLAEDRAARLSASATLRGSDNAFLWAEVFAVLREYKDRALSLPFQPVKRG